MKDTILSISGRPGLFRLVAQGHGNLIVENILDKKRSAAGGRDRVTSLNDVSMYTDEDDVALTQVFENIFKATEGKKASIDYKRASEAEMRDFMATALPNYDRERVHVSDMRKLAQWYNILIEAGVTEFADEAPTTEDNE